VDREVITLSEAELVQEIGMLGGGAEEQPLTAVVERLIETHLIEREVKRYPGEPVPAEQVKQAADSIRHSFPSDQAYRQALDDQGMTEEALQNLVKRQIAINRYLERRFRPLVHVSDEEVQHFYEEELLPALRAGNETEPSLEPVRESIRRILAERKFNQRVNEWMEALKTRSHIRRYVW
jgi:hypothetical protein